MRISPYPSKKGSDTCSVRNSKEHRKGYDGVQLAIICTIFPHLIFTFPGIHVAPEKVLQEE